MVSPVGLDNSYVSAKEKRKGKTYIESAFVRERAKIAKGRSRVVRFMTRAARILGTGL